jgi:uncharacterized repeat protein (TIGR02543 family)
MQLISLKIKQMKKPKRILALILVMSLSMTTLAGLDYPPEEVEPDPPCTTMSEPELSAEPPEPNEQTEPNEPEDATAPCCHVDGEDCVAPTSMMVSFASSLGWAGNEGICEECGDTGLPRSNCCDLCADCHWDMYDEEICPDCGICDNCVCGDCGDCCDCDCDHDDHCGCLGGSDCEPCWVYDNCAGCVYVCGCGGDGNGGDDTLGIDLNDFYKNESGDGWSWNYSTKTLTLTNLNLTSSGAAILMPNGVASTIVLIGNNTIKSNDTGINATGNLTIQGSGILNIDSEYAGIFVCDGFDLTINDSTIIINAKDDNGIRAGGNIEITDAVITVIAEWYGIIAQYGDVTITGGTFEITADEYGIWSIDNITIDNAKITLVTRGNGIVASSNIEVSATEIKINSRNSGISSGGNVTITGGTFEIESVENGIVGIDVTISGSGIVKKEAVGETSVVRAFGMLTHPGMNVFGWGGTGYTVASVVGKPWVYAFVNAVDTDEELSNIQFVPITSTVTFNANGGTPSEATRTVGHNTAIGTLPTALQSGYSFDGWFTQASGGTQISATTIITGHITYYAQWTYTGSGDTGGGDTDGGGTGTDPDSDSDPEPPDYTFNGGNNTFVQGAGQPLVLTIQKDFALFDDVLVNNTALIQGIHYTATSGSTIITKLPAYLNTLQPGTYTVEIRFTDGDNLITTFTIEAIQQNNPPVIQNNPDTGAGLPQTGVLSYIVLFTSLLLISTAGAIFTLSLMKRKTEQERG